MPCWPAVSNAITSLTVPTSASSTLACMSRRRASSCVASCAVTTSSPSTRMREASSWEATCEVVLWHSNIANISPKLERIRGKVAHHECDVMSVIWPLHYSLTCIHPQVF